MQFRPSYDSTAFNRPISLSGLFPHLYDPEAHLLDFTIELRSCAFPWAFDLFVCELSEPLRHFPAVVLKVFFLRQ
jgi:hypothetical protein